MAACELIAALGDTLTLVSALMVARYALVAMRGDDGGWGLAAAWLRRIAIVAILLVVLRLGSIAAARPDIAAPVAAIAAAILLSGILLIVLDRWATRLLTASRDSR